MSSPYDDLVPGNDNSANPEPTHTELQSQETNMGKSIFKSKTMWINVLTALAGVIAAVGGSEVIQANPEYAGYAATAIGIMNIFLRFITKEPVKIK